MAKKASAAKPSGRTNKPGAAPVESGRQRKPQRQPEVAALDSPPTLAERVEVQRTQLLRAASVVECCKYASASLFNADDSEYMVPAFELVMDLLDTSAGELERIALECEALDRKDEGRAQTDKEL